MSSHTPKGDKVVPFRTRQHLVEVRKILERLKRNDPRLKEVVVSGADAGDNSVARVVHALGDSTHVTSLALRHTSLSEEGVRSLCRALMNNSRITELDLFGTELGDNGAIAVAKLVDYNTVVSTLGLAQCHIGDDGARALSVVLRRSHSLRSLTLSQNPLGPEGATLIAGALEANDSLETLSLLSCRVGNAGAAALASALTNGARRLAKLALWDDTITNVGALALSEALAAAPALTEVTILSAGFRGSGGRAIAAAIRANGRIKLLNLWDDSVGPAAAREVLETVEDNKELYVNVWGARAQVGIPQVPRARVKVSKDRWR
jgi:Ran GTPase-activating protein (RanGAP) involved in mRNA processing and transport